MASKAWEIQKIDRSSPTADALRGKSEKDGYELFETNRRHYLLRRPKNYAPAKTDKGDSGDEEKGTDEKGVAKKSTKKS